MHILRRHKRHLIILLITVLFAVFLIQYNQIACLGLYDTVGKTFENARVVYLLEDNETEPGNQIGTEIVSFNL